MQKRPWDRAIRAKFLIAFGLMALVFDAVVYAGRQSSVEAERAAVGGVVGDVSMTPHLIVGGLAVLAILAGVILIASTPEQRD